MLSQIQQKKLVWNASSKIGSLGNTAHKPGGGDRKIETVKLDFSEKAKPKIGSKANIKHVAGGGDIKVHPPLPPTILHFFSHRNARGIIRLSNFELDEELLSLILIG